MLAGLWVPVLKTIFPSHLCSKVQPHGQVLANGMEIEMVCTTLEIILKGRRHDFFFPFFSPFWWLMWANNWGFNRQCLVPLREQRRKLEYTKFLTNSYQPWMLTSRVFTWSNEMFWVKPPYLGFLPQDTELSSNKYKEKSKSLSFVAWALYHVVS